MNPKNLLILLLSLLAISCSKMSVDVTIPTVRILDISDNGSQTFTIKAEIDGITSIQNCGFYCSSNINLQSPESYSSRLIGSSFEADITLSQRNHTYYVYAFISNGSQEIISDVIPVKSDDSGVYVDFPVVDLSSHETANCYIVSNVGTYKFKTVMGNSSESVGSVSYCSVLWESFGTSVTPMKGDLIKEAVYEDNGYVVFQTALSFRKGNASIAACDKNGNILWSWHIWLTDEPDSQEYLHGAGFMMDRNLGATSAIPGDVGALGLLYQWGRKDPFLGSSSIVTFAEAKSTVTWPEPDSSSLSYVNGANYSIKYPMTFFQDWHSAVKQTFWQSGKTIYDPCPARWRVPYGGQNGVWATAFGTSDRFKRSSNWDSSKKGMDFSKTSKKLGSSGPIWYPAVGCDYTDKVSVGSVGRYWSVSLYASRDAYVFEFYSDGEVSKQYAYEDCSNRFPVRCLREY